jgi:uncharacterized protein
MAYYILSCDGGGIRGLLPALVIQQLQNDIKGPNGQDFLSGVSLFAGTSAGGLVSLGLASGLSCGQVVSLFADDGQ